MSDNLTEETDSDEESKPTVPTANDPPLPPTAIIKTMISGRKSLRTPKCARCRNHGVVSCLKVNRLSFSGRSSTASSCPGSQKVLPMARLYVCKLFIGGRTATDHGRPSCSTQVGWSSPISEWNDALLSRLDNRQRTRQTRRQATTVINTAILPCFSNRSVCRCRRISDNYKRVPSLAKWFAVSVDRLEAFQRLSLSGLKAKNHKNESNRINRLSSSPILNDRLRKRRCFADKELDNIPALSSTLETMVTNSAFRVASLSRFRSRELSKAPAKKWTDFSVAAIIGQS